MRQMQRIRRSHELRQNQIVDAVARLITVKGMDSVTIHDIAGEVGVTEAAIYRHFVSKRQIFSYVIYKWKESLIASVRAGAQEEITALHTLEQAFWSQLSEVENHRALSSIVIVQAISFEGAGLGAEVASVIDEYLQAVRRLLLEGVQEGSVRPDISFDAAATNFFGMIQSTATMWALNGYTSPLAENGARMWEIYKRGIAATASQA